jgi:hypothetical protein
VNFLELLSDAAATSSSLEVSWRPPSKNSERITGYKLMVATSTGAGGGGGQAAIGMLSSVYCPTSVKMWHMLLQLLQLHAHLR